jgi:hypothetical protein
LVTWLLLKTSFGRFLIGWEFVIAPSPWE